MTLAEYMDPAKFPLTTQKGLNPQQQLMIDAVNYDDLAPYEELGKAMSDEQKRIWAELQQKHAARPELIT